MHSTPTTILRAATVLGLLLVLSGCGTTYRFKVDAVKNQEIPETKKSFRIVSANPEMDEEDLRFKQTANYVKTALSAKGMYEAPPGLPADMTVEIDWGMEEPKQKVSVKLVPVPFVHTVMEPVTRVDGYVDKATGKFVATRTYVVMEPVQRTDYPMEEQLVTETVREKYMRVTCKETPAEAGDHPPRELWSVYVSNEDESDNLPEYVPMMVSAAMDSMDKESTSQREVTMTKDDARAAFVKKGM